MKQELRDVRDEIKRRRPKEESERLGGFRKMTVQAVTAPTVTLRLAGSAVDITAVRRLASYTPTAGDDVWVWESPEGELLVLGKEA